MVAVSLKKKAAITPWNYPVSLAVWKIAPALRDGNPSVLKPSPVTPLSTLRLGEILRDVLPYGVMNVVARRNVNRMIVDLARGQPFFTPGALGSALFLGSTAPTAVSVSVATVAGSTIFHIGAFFALGFVGSAIAGYAEDTPPLIIAAVMLFMAFEAFFMGLMALSAEFLLSSLAWWAIVVGNVLATLTMGSYLWTKHPKLREARAAHPIDKPA